MERPVRQQGAGIVQGEAQQANVIRPNMSGSAGVRPMAADQDLGGDNGDPQSAFEDFWRTGGLLDEGGTTLGGTDSVLVTDPQAGAAHQQGARSKGLIFLILTLLVLGAVTIYLYGMDWDPIAAFSDLLGSDQEATSSEPPSKNEPAPKETAETASDESFLDESRRVEKPEGPSVIDGNPYWALPNAIEGYQPLFPVWTAVQEEGWRSGIAHKYPYQRLKTVLEVRFNRRRGAQTILWEALEDKKAWTRLYAAIGLAEYNIPLANKILLKAIGRSRPELIAGFFERFVKKPNPGQAFIMRQAIRLLDEGGRLTCLRGIWNSRDRFRDLYIAAATLDPGPRVRAWVKGVLLQRSMPLERFDRLVAMAQGKAPFKEFDVKGLERKGESPDSSDFESGENATEEDRGQRASGEEGSPQEVFRSQRSSKGADPGDVLFFDAPSAAKTKS